MKCVFCELPEIKKRALVKNDLAFAFLTNIPITPGHTLISAKRCVAFFSDLTKEEREAISELANNMRGVLVKAFGAEGFNFAWNEGEVGGQAVPHFHLHIVPRKKGDAGITEYEPRKFLYRPGSRVVSPEEELKEVEKIIKGKL